MSRWAPLRQLIWARLREFTREPASIFWVYGFPLIMIVTLGMAFQGQPIEKIRVAIERGSLDDVIAEGLARSERFESQIISAEEARVELRTGRVDLIIRGGSVATLEPTSSTVVDLDELRAGTLEFLYDDTRPGSVLARDAADQALQRAAGRTDPVTTTDTIVEEPGSGYVDFLVPGLIGLSLMGGGMWGVGYAIVDMRIRKLLKRFVATPMRRSDFLIGIMTSRLLFLIPEFVLLLVFAKLAFGVQSQGGYLPVALLILLGAIQFSGIGLLVASRAATIETISGLMNLVMLPMWIFGGVFFSNERFPDFLQPMIAVLPLTPLINSLRLVMLEGATLIDVAPQIGIMAIWSAATFSIALATFKWK